MREVTSIPISAVKLGEAEERLAMEVIRSGRLAQGPMVERLETAFAQLTHTRHAVAVSSGTVALVAALQGLGIGPGDEVVTTPFTFVATLNAILQVGATARFADVTDEDLTISPAAVEAALTPRTAALLPVHLYGKPARVDVLDEVARAHGLALVEDAAQAPGAAIGGQPVGSFGVGCFSLYATKNVTTGEGGVITTDDDALADRLRVLRNQGMRNRYEYVVPGYNYRLTELQAAIALPQLERLAELDERRRANAEALDQRLAHVTGLRLPSVTPGQRHVFHQYTVRVTPSSPLGRDNLAEALRVQAIDSGIYYPRAVYDYDCYRENPQLVIEPMPVAEQAATQVLSLPVHPSLTLSQVDRIAGAVCTALGVGPPDR